MLLKMGDSKPTKLIVALGNPGAKYDGTRHNIGFALLDSFAKKYNFSFKLEKKFEAELAIQETEITHTKTKKIKVQNGEEIEKKTIEEKFSKTFKLILAKPQTFMNKSGDAVSKLIKFYKIPIEDMIVLHDDVAMDTGKLRLAFDRGAGGQHGIEDIIEKLGGDKKFHRLKIGVGPDPGGDIRGDYVLARFPKSQSQIVLQVLTEAMVMLETYLLSSSRITEA